MSKATEVEVEMGSLITRAPEILGGKPCIKGHRVGVHRIAGWWKMGLTVEQIGERFPALSPAEIHVALAYYHLHRDEIEGYLDEDRAAKDGLKEKLPVLP